MGDVQPEGVGRRLVESAVEWARAQRVAIVPHCAYARAVLTRDPGTRDVLAPG